MQYHALSLESLSSLAFKINTIKEMDEAEVIKFIYFTLLNLNIN
jgi:hypothetical protein